MEVNIGAMNFLGKTENDVSDVSSQFDMERQRELWIV